MGDGGARNGVPADASDPGVPNVGANGFGRASVPKPPPDPPNPSNPKSSLEVPAPVPFAEPEPVPVSSSGFASSFVRADRDDHAELDLGRPAEAS